jgi:TetR/AcrR family transcriptional regulator, cholesterol catabolism regulator
LSFDEYSGNFFLAKRFQRVKSIYICAMTHDKRKEIELIGSVAQLFMRLGIRSLTMDEIARQLGVSKKTLYKYASDKKELVTKAVRLAIDEEECVLSEMHKAEGSAIDKIFAINTMISEKLQSIQPAVIFDMQKYYPEAWAIMEEHKCVFIHNQVKENLEEGIKEGLYRKNMNPELVTRIYVTLINSIFDSSLYSLSTHSFKETYTEVVRYHLRGITNEKGVEYMQQLFNNPNSDTI